MQISTKDKDYLIDTLVPEVRESLGILNIVFCDPNILKIFHGAESDIVWLQKDFGIYVVNIFDTFHVLFIYHYYNIYINQVDINYYYINMNYN